MFKNRALLLKRRLLSTFSFLALGVSGVWLGVANLGCLTEELLDGMRVVLDPHRIDLEPNLTKTSRAEVMWGNDSVGPSSWKVDGDGIDAIVSATVSPRNAYETTISITAGDYDAVYNPARFSFSSYTSYDVPVAATFDHPVASAALGGGVKVTRQKYLALEANRPILELTVPAFQPIVQAESGLMDGMSSVRGLVFGAKAEIKNAPTNWKYSFKFDLRVEASDEGTKVYLRPADIPTKTDPGGKWATIKFNDLNLGMDAQFDDSQWGLNAKFGAYFIYLNVEATRIGKDEKPFLGSEFIKYPFYIGHLSY